MVVRGFLFLFATVTELLAFPPPGPVVDLTHLESVCSSNGGLCDMAFGFGDPAVMVPSTGQICACPGNDTCPVTQDDPSRVLLVELPGGAQFLKTTVRLSYCWRKKTPKRKCQLGDYVLTMEGGSPFPTKIVGEIACECSQPLVLHAARPDGVYTLQDFSCGKATCNINKSDPPVCERLTTSKTMLGLRTSSEILCQCPDGFECSGSSFFKQQNGVKEITCEISFW